MSEFGDRVAECASRIGWTIKESGAPALPTLVRLSVLDECGHGGEIQMSRELWKGLSPSPVVIAELLIRTVTGSRLSDKDLAALGAGEYYVSVAQVDKRRQANATR